MNGNAETLSEQELNNIRNLIVLTGQMLRTVDLESLIANAQRYSSFACFVVSPRDYQDNEPIISGWTKVAEAALKFRITLERFEALVEAEAKRRQEGQCRGN